MPAPERSALTNRQLAMASAVTRLIDKDAARLQRDALEGAALAHLQLAYRRLLAELAEQASVELAALPDSAASLLDSLNNADAAHGGVHQCVALERAGWLADMRKAHERAQSLLPPVAAPRSAQDVDVIAVSAEPTPMPLEQWLASLRALIAELRESSLEW